MQVLVSELAQAETNLIRSDRARFEKIEKNHRRAFRYSKISKEILKQAGTLTLAERPEL